MAEAAVAFDYEQPADIWPIEVSKHPSFRQFDAPGETELNLQVPLLVDNLRLLNVLTNGDRSVHEEDDEWMNACELATVALSEHPRCFRNMILRNVKIRPNTQFDGKGVICAWPTKRCPVGCEFCFFSSPKTLADKGSSEWGDEEVTKFLQFLEDANIGELRVAGGGEPFLKPRYLNRILRSAKVDEINLVTSGIWAKSPGATRKILHDLSESLAENPHKPKVNIRLSFDNDHFEKIAPGGDLSYVQNIINVFRQEYADTPNFNFVIHTMKGDIATQALLNSMPIKERIPVPEKRREVIVLEDGFRLIVKYAKLFYSDRQISMRDKKTVDRNIAIFDHDVNNEQHLGNLAVVPNADGKKGFNFSLHYNGALFSYGASSPDNEASLCTHTYQQVIDKMFGDVLSLAVIEKGNAYRDAIVEEVNPIAVVRAKAMGIRDGYARSLLEEERTRTYVSIRIIQNYIAEGRITQDEMKDWPTSLLALLAIPREILIDAYKSSKHNIVTQYLNCPQLRIADLVILYEMVGRGHYDVTAQEMLRQVFSSDKITQQQKWEFYNRVTANSGAVTGN